MLAGSQPLALGATPSADQSFLVVLRPQESLLAIMSEDWSCSILSPKESQDISNNPDEERARHSGGEKVSVCMCVYSYVCACVHTCLCTYVYLCMNVSACVHVCAFVVRVCTYGCIFSYACVHLCVHVCAHMCVHVCAHMCVCLHMHCAFMCVGVHMCAHLLSMCAPVFSG